MRLTAAEDASPLLRRAGLLAESSATEECGSKKRSRECPASTLVEFGLPARPGTENSGMAKARPTLRPEVFTQCFFLHPRRQTCP